MSKLHNITDDDLLDRFIKESDLETVQILKGMLCERMTAVMSLAIDKHAYANALAGYESREDILQDAYKAFLVMIEALRKYPGRKQITDLPAYVYSLAKNECTGTHRRRRFKKSSSVVASPDLPSRVADGGVPQDQSLIIKEYLTHYIRELERLPDIQRQAFMLGNHRDFGPDTMNFLLQMEICGAEKLASLMGLSLERFDEISIPLARPRIALLMGKSEEEVAALQGAAVKRLKRRRVIREWFGFQKR